MTKPAIFISYSHEDEPWLAYVQSHLQPAVKHGVFELWVDEHIPGGTNWEQEIKEKIQACDIFVLLLSRHSLSSYVINTEIELIREREKREDVHIFPIALTRFPISAMPWLDGVNLRPKGGKPLSEFSVHARNTEMAALVIEIVDTVAQIAKGRSRIPVRLLTPAPRVQVDFTHLPETAYEHLVGREAELRFLNDAWRDAKVNIVSVIGEGGSGKSALVNEWLKKLQAKNYGGAEAVLGWSFYSQGSKERSSSAENFLNWALDKLELKVETTSAVAKGEAIAQEIAKRRVLLVLDGIEPLQHGPGPQFGQLKDSGLRALLRRFSAAPFSEKNGLIVLTSGAPIVDISRWKDSTSPIVHLDELTAVAGAALLRDNGVWGTDEELEAAARDFGGHALSLGLLAGFLKETQLGDVRRRDHVRALLFDPDNPRYDHARRVMESYEKEWLGEQPILLEIMHIVGLFDRPASGDCLHALRVKPVIAGLTNLVVKLSEDEWQRAVARLREVRLLAPPDPSAPDALDTHPIVREWFGERLRQGNNRAWREAHGRLYEHLRDSTKEGSTPNLAELAPLYQAITHGSRAGRHQEALNDIFKDRICRRYPDGRVEFYSVKNLGAIGSDLAAISRFFAVPYELPVSSLNEADRSWVLRQASFYLGAQGRLSEALPIRRIALSLDEAAQDWHSAAISASNLAEAELIVGNVSAAKSMIGRALRYSELSGNLFETITNRTNYAAILLAEGNRVEALHLFSDAERRQREQQPEYPLLYSVQGYRYCDLLIATGDYAAAHDRAIKILESETELDSLFDRAIVRLALGRADLGLALSSGDAGRELVSAVGYRLDKAVEGLLAAGTMDQVPRGVLARGAFRRMVGDWDGAARDLDEVEEIAEPGPMRLFLCDMALERARLSFARNEAFAPLHGFTDNSPSELQLPGDIERKRLHDEAAKQLAIAGDYVKSCGYNRRDEELAELVAVLRGEKKFAELPPRV
jgi:tetratricopeptide (TPR) repeat protein